VVVGLVVGLALALAVALWVTKSPVPFVEKVPSRTQEQDAAEAERNRNWDPNSPLYGKSPAKAASAATVTSGSVTPAVPAEPVAPAIAASDLLPENDAALPPLSDDRGALVPPGERDVAAIDPAASVIAPAKRPVPKPEVKPAEVKPEVKPDATKVDAKTAKVDPATLIKEAGANDRFLVQVGAYTSSADAEHQRAKLAMNGLSAKISERERDGKIFYRVRLGSYKPEEAEAVRKQVSAIGYGEAALVRVTSK
jgi:cell division protein FtsN